MHLRKNPLNYYKTKDLVAFTVRVHPDLYRWLVQESLIKGESMSRNVWSILNKHRRREIKALNNVPRKKKPPRIDYRKFM